MQVKELLAEVKIDPDKNFIFEDEDEKAKSVKP